MAQRFSLLSNRIEEVPDTPAKGAPPDPAGRIADLRVQLATAQAQLEAARSECSTLTDRLAKADAELTVLRNRPAASIPAPVVNVPETVPASYEVRVKSRDWKDRIETVELIPKE